MTAIACASAVGAARVPVLEFGQAVAVPCAAIAWTARSGFRGWAIFLTTGLVFVSIAAPGRFADFAAGAVAGWVVGESTRQGRGAEWAITWAILPFAFWTAALAAGGLQPFTEDLRVTIERMIGEAGRRGEFSAEGLAQLRASSDRAIEIARRTWVGVEIAEFCVALLIARAIAHPGKESFGRFNVSDAMVWVFAGGLAAYLAGQVWLPRAVATVGLNAIVFASVIYFIRGMAIEWYWLGRTGMGRALQVGLLAGGFVLFLPFHALATAALGLFDTWFDFRKLKSSEEEEDPLRVSHQSSGDDT